MKISIRKISELTGFSPATVSNALNHKKGVNADTMAEIFRVARETGYISEKSIIKIKLVVFKKNGLILEDTPFFSKMIGAMEEECRNCGYEMVICNLDQKEAHFNEVRKTILDDSSSAVILLGTEMLDGDLRLFEGMVSPMVVLDHGDETMRFHTILINNEDSAYMATEYLIKNGHKEIGYLRGAYRIKGFRSRFIGYQTALRRNKIAIQDKYIVTLETTYQGAYENMSHYLESNRKLPTAFFADNDMIAMGAMKALIEKGYRIPEEISLVGFDDLPYSEIMTPPLTTIRVPRAEMGRLAVRKVVSLINGQEEVITKTQVCTKFIERKSVVRISIEEKGVIEI